MKWWMGAQTALLIVVLLGIGLQQRRIGRLEAEVVALGARPARGPTTIAVQGPGEGGMQRMRGRGPMPAMRMAAQADGAEPVAREIDDHLWSEEGRAVIDDVVQAREEQERERRGDRWRQMAEVRRDRMIEKARADFDLDDGQVEDLRDVLTSYGEKRRELWQQMRGDGEVDAAKLMDQGEQARETMQARLGEILGEEGAEALLGEMRGPF